MTIDVFCDRFNQLKEWHVKRYACGHYYWRQKVAGQWVGKWSRVDVNHMLNVIAG